VLSCFIYVIGLILVFANPLLAADISLTITQKNLNDSVLIEVLNTSTQDVVVESIEIDLNQKAYIHTAREIIKTRASKEVLFPIQQPDIPGSYIIISTVKYLNDGIMLSVRHADILNAGKPALLPSSCNLDTTKITGSGEIRLTAPQNYRWKLVMPVEIETRALSMQENTHFYQAKSKVKGFTNTFQIYSVAETVTGNLHQAGLCSATMTITSGTSPKDKGWIPAYIFLIFSCIFFSLTFFISFLVHKGDHVIATLFRYGSRMFFLGISCWILKEANLWLASSLNYISWTPYQGLARILLDTINGGNYAYFFQFFVDGYFVLCLIFLFPCLYWFDSKTAPSRDKYVAAFTTIASFPWLLAGKKPSWNALGKLGLLTILLKFFFTPIMVSWAIGGLYNIANGLRSFQWNVYAINAYLVQLLIFVDTVIFSIGYLLESKYLKNEIKSVDPTFLGWLVCLWCYPPFNAFSFKPFDFYIIRISLSNPAWLHVIVLCVITCLWGIFVWASVALGFKASNLTNRGIVRSGPYRFARHPAYMAKLLIWILQGVFFAQFGVLILLGFILIYVLRTWTEERHLSRDQDYIDYKKLVRWWFIPRLI
jgi:protein-S-isoprenylcysteine O-methyltransferase Ste14